MTVMMIAWKVINLKKNRQLASAIRCPNRFFQPRYERCMSTNNENTYYDSQSGQHVPIHDESKICGYLLGNSVESNKSPKDTVQTARSLGLAGSLLPPLIPQKRDVIDSSASDTWFLHMPPTLFDRLSFDELVEGNKSNERINLCFEYSYQDGDTAQLSSLIQKVMIEYGKDRTSLGIFDAKCYKEDPILVASDVANVIDTTGGCSHVLLSPDDLVKPDDIVSLCEELTYLDVPGPTVKSRLVVRAVNGEQVEECLQMGISKFLLNDDDGESLDVLESAVSSAGKELVRM